MRQAGGRALARVLIVLACTIWAAPFAAGAPPASGKCSLAADAPRGEYIGECRNGLAHGRGAAEGPEYRYQGEFFEGRRHGRGSLHLKDGSRYEGEFSHGKRHGHGIAVLPNGARHEGAWRDGAASGRGVLVFADGARYDGDFRDSQRHGQGVYIRADGAIWSGEWQGDRFTNGILYSADRRTTRTVANGVVTHVSGPGAPAQAPVAAAPARTPAQACDERADSCETACAVGVLAGALLSRGKVDGNKENAECAARCQASRQSCLASAGGSPQAPAPAAETASGAGARRFCAPDGQNWCMHDRLIDAPPYPALKKACSVIVGKFDTFSRQYTIEAVGNSEEALRGNIERFEQETRPQVREYLRDHAELSRCILESGLLQFRSEGGHYFRMSGYAFNVRRFPRSVWATAVRHTQSQHAKGMSTRVFELAQWDPPEYVKHLALEKECGTGGGALSPYYPRAWWEETLAYLDRTIQEADRRGFKQPQVPKTLLKQLQCHQQHGWPLAAENQFYVLYQGGRDRADR